MSNAAVVFDSVWKKFRRGERADSLRDLIPAMVRSVGGRRKSDDAAADEFWAVKDVSFEVKNGEALGIIGPNGAGKSTTLKLLTRILRPTRGHAHVHGRVGALIEVSAGFHGDLTGRENIFLQGAIMGMRRAEIAKKLDGIIDFAGIESFIDTPVKRYSSGMNARLGFSIATHLDPDVLIVDEVLSVGDMAFQQRCMDRMRQFKNAGVAIVFVSHNLQASASLCDRLLLLRGEVLRIGPPEDVIRAYIADQGARTPVLPASEVELRGGLMVDEHDKEVDVVSPGSNLHMSFTGRFTAEIEDLTFGLVVRRVSDQLVVYDVNYSSQELGLERSKPGEEFSLNFALAAHLTRGQYDVSCHVFHNPSQRFLAQIRSAAIFSVHEEQTWAGIANLGATATVHKLSAGACEAGRTLLTAR